MSNIDCGVFPSRAEGWNLELLECMSCGKQVITTNYSAHTEFCNQDNSHLVSISEKELAYDGKWFQGQQGFWAKINQEAQDSFIEYMRHVHNNKSLNIHGIETGKKFTWSNSTEKMVQYV
jgi:glycosyltransferase involved in cell wall biosynthesis